MKTTNYLMLVLACVTFVLVECSKRNTSEKDNAYAEANGIGIDTTEVDILKMINENLQIISVIIESDVIISDTSTEYRGKRINWKLKSEDVLSILKLSKEISGSEMHDYYYDLPCKIKGKIFWHGDSLNFIANAGSFIYIYSKQKGIYLGCSSKACKKLFVLQGGDIKRDLPKD